MTESNKFKFTVAKLRALPRAEAKKVAWYYDAELTGFCLRISGSTKTYVAKRRVNGKVKDRTLARFDEITLDQARQMARETLFKMRGGVDPVQEKKREQEANAARSIKLVDVFELYLQTRNIRESTVKSYRCIFDFHLSDWKDRLISSITKQEIIERHKKIGNESHSQANKVGRLLRSLFNYAIEMLEDNDGNVVMHRNPANVLTNMNLWYSVAARETYISDTDLAAWYRGVEQLRTHQEHICGDVFADYFLVVCLTGLRLEEALTLRCKDVNLGAKPYLLVRGEDTKNGKDHILPLSDWLVEILKRRMPNGSEWVFLNEYTRTHIVNPNKSLKRITELSGVTFKTHDLRRTFAGCANSLDYAEFKIKKLLNHSLRNNVTAGYVLGSLNNIENLREPMQRITDTLRRAMLGDQSNVVSFQKVNQE